MRLVVPLAIALALALTAVPARADHCTTYSTSTTDAEAGVIVLDLRAVHPANLVDYVVIEPCLRNCVFMTYHESNGLDGLQRNDKIVDDTCHGLVRADAPF